MAYEEVLIERIVLYFHWNIIFCMKLLNSDCWQMIISNYICIHTYVHSFKPYSYWGSQGERSTNRIFIWPLHIHLLSERSLLCLRNLFSKINRSLPFTSLTTHLWFIYVIYNYFDVPKSSDRVLLHSHCEIFASTY